MEHLDRAARDLAADHALRGMLPLRDTTRVGTATSGPIRVIDSGTFTHHDVETNEDGVMSVIERHERIGSWTDNGDSE